MTNRPRMSGRLIAAGRALSGVSLADLADAAGIPLSRLRRLAASGAAILESASDAAALCRALEDKGVVVVPEDAELGAGVRLKFTRLDVRQIARLENEGGPARDDDVP